MQLIGYTGTHWVKIMKNASLFLDVFLLNGAAISWASKKQTCIVLSTMKAEFIALASAIQVGIWLKRFLHNLGGITTSSTCYNLL